MSDEKLAAGGFAGTVSRLIEAARFVAGYREALPSFGTTARPEDEGFRRLSGRSEKELTSFEWRKQMAVAYYLWQNNAFACRIVELFTDYVVGDGFDVTAKDPEVQKVIDKHWDDPDNAWDMNQFESAQELGLFGTLLFKPFVNKENGHVKLSPVDPMWISDIIPDNNKAGVVHSIVVRMNGVASPETWRVVHQDEDPASPTFGKMVGEVFYFAVNKLRYTMQGISDLYRLADWLDGFDQFVFHAMERIVFLNAHVYDITLTSATPEQVKARAKELELNPPRAGGFRVHDEKEAWDALAPKLNTAELEQMSRLVKMLILGSSGIPEHWFADGGNVNRATAEEMAPPILRKLKRRQAQWRDILTAILNFQIDQAIIAGKLPNDVNREFTVAVPEVSSKDAEGMAKTLLALTDALVSAQDAGYIQRGDAAKMWGAQASELGAEVTAPTDAQAAASAADKAARTEVKAVGVEGSAYRELRSKRAPPASAPAQATGEVA